MNIVIPDWSKIWIALIWIQLGVMANTDDSSTGGGSNQTDDSTGCNLRTKQVFTNFLEVGIDIELKTPCHSCCCSNLTNQVRP